MDTKESGQSSELLCYAFGPYLVDLRRRLLWKERTVVPLKSKTMEVLAVLVEHRGRLLKKDELLRLAWVDDNVLESNLVQQISLLRRALGQRPDQHDYIVTVPGRGYQFVADVREVPCPSVGLPTSFESNPPSTTDDERSIDPEIEAATGSVPEPEEHVAPEARTVADTDGLALGFLPPRWWRSPALVGAVSITAILLIAGLFILDRQSPPSQRRLRQFTFESGLPREPSWSPDGQRIAYTADHDGNTDIWVQPIGSPDPIRLTTSPAQDWQPDWSPDGTQLVFRSERDGGGLYVVSSTGGESRRITEFGDRPHWSPDGTLILFSSSTVRTGSRGLYVVPPAGGSPQAVRNDLVAEFTSGNSFVSVNASWYPDGRRISIWGRHPQSGWTLLTAPIDGGAAIESVMSSEIARAIEGAGVTFSTFVWAPSRRYLYFEGQSEEARNLWRVTVDPQTLAWISGPERLTTSAGEDTNLAVSADGTKLAFSVRSSRTRLWALPLDTAAEVLAEAGSPVTSGGPDELDGDAPIDGSKVVYRVVRGGRQELRTHSILNGQDVMLVASSDLNRSAPRWSPDGRLLAYQVSRRLPNLKKAEFAVALLPTDGGLERLLTVPGQTRMVPTDWSRNGDLLLGWCGYGDSHLIGTCLLSVTDAGQNHQARLITQDPTFNLFCQRFSPNQQWISFVAAPTRHGGLSKIYVVPVKGNEWIQMTDGAWLVDKPRWAPDGRTLYYISDRDGFLNVWGRRFDPVLGRPEGAAFRVTAFASEQRVIPAKFAQLEMAVASTKLFLPLQETSGDIWILDHIDKEP